MFPHLIRQKLTRAAAVLVAGWLVLCLSAADALAQDRVALVIGNSAYEHAKRLPNPSNDARDITEKLEALGFSVLTTLDADLPQLREQVQAFGDAARDAEIALVFYAGHGMQVSGQNYLLPVDARIASREDLPTATLPASEVFDVFIRAAPKLAVLILDACRDNPFISAVATSQGLATGGISASTFVSRPGSAGMVISFAAAPGEVAFDGDDGNSPFTTALLRWLDRPGLELSTMFREVRVTVLQLTRMNQVPWIEEALLRDIFLNPGQPEEPPPADQFRDALLNIVGRLFADSEKSAGADFVDRLTGEETAQPAVEVREEEPDPDFERQGLIWVAMRDSTDTEIFERFLGKFPDGRFAEQARARLEELREAPPAETPEYLSHLTPTPEASPTAVEGAEVEVPETVPADVDVAETGVTETVPAEIDVAAEDEPPGPADVEAGLAFDNDELAAIQSLLQAAGFYGGAIDADFGPGTRGGIERFQTDEALPGTGFLDNTTLDHLVRRAARPVLLGDLAAPRRAAVHRVAAVATRGVDAEPEVIQVVPISRRDSVHEYWRSLADDFEASRPGTRIEIAPMPGVEYQARLLSMLGSDDPPEILYTWGGGHLEALRNAGFARDLTDEMAEGWAFQFKPGVLQNYIRDGRIYGAPTHISLVSLYVNARVMEQAGVDIGQLETWDGLISAVRQLREQGITPLAIGGADRWPFALFYGKLVQNLGGREAYANALAGREGGFRADPFVEAGARLAELAALDPWPENALELSDGDAAEVFAEGGAAMMVTGNWRLAKMRFSWPGGRDAMAEDLVRLDFPRAAGQTPGIQTYGGVDGLAVRAGAPDSAVEFLRVLASRSAQEQMTELTSNVPSLSSADLAIEDPYLSDVAANLTESTYHQLFIDQVVGPSVGEVVTEASVLLGTGAMTGEEAADAIDRAWADFAGVGGDTASRAPDE